MKILNFWTVQLQFTSMFFNQFILATRKGIQSQGNRKFRVRSICISKLQTGDMKWHQCHKWQLLQINQIWCLALAVTSDGNIDQLGNGDNWNLGVQNNAKKICKQRIIWSTSGVIPEPEMILTRRPCWVLEIRNRFLVAFLYFFDL